MAAESAADLYYSSGYDRRMDAVAGLAESIRDNASHILLDLERGRIPRIRSLLDSAQRLAVTLAELDALAEMKKVYDSLAESTGD